MPSPSLRIASFTDPGARGGNEDDLRHGSTALGHYAVLADGAGGHARGEEASYRAVECVARGLGDAEALFQPATLTALAYLAHEELLRALRGARRADQRMHTTLVVLWLDAPLERALWTHVGDSRLYRVRDGRCEVLTQDDSVVQHMVRSGLLTQEQGRAHPNKNQLLAALGIDGEITPHTLTEAAELRGGDAFLLCSDGWWDHFEPADIAAALARAESPEQWLADMRRQIVHNAAPRQDNYSAIALWVGEPPRVQAAAS